MTVFEPGRLIDETTLPTPSQSMKPLSARAIAVVAAVVLTLTVGAVTGLLWWVNSTGGIAGPELTTARLDAIKIGLSTAIAGGGVFALYLAWRRQRSNEADHQLRERVLEHQHEVASDNKFDALERRVTELYTKAAEQLGSDKAPVRLAGIYALERLAQNNPNQRQTVVNVLCAYLRMPYDLPPDVTPTDDTESDPDDMRERIQEREVRLTAQHVLTDHLHPPPEPTDEHIGSRHRPFWPKMSLDLTGAVLVNFNLTFCRIDGGTFDRALFVRPASFRAVTSTGFISFVDAEFTHHADFGHARLSDGALFVRTRFGSKASFTHAQLGCDNVFNDAEFVAAVYPSGVINGDVVFDRTIFGGLTDFTGASFHGRTWLGDISFTGHVDLHGVEFTNRVDFHPEISPQLRDLMRNHLKKYRLAHDEDRHQRVSDEQGSKGSDEDSEDIAD